MAYGRRRSYARSRGPRPVINSIKNNHNLVIGVLASTNHILDSVIASDNPVTTGAGNQVKNGCIIKAFHVQFWYYGQTAGATNDIIDCYVIKNPGNNITPPNPGTVGTSNEKKFVFREWKGLAGVKSLGGTPFTNRVGGEWIRIPKRYQRFGTDDRLQFVVRSPTIGDFCIEVIYKWYT